MTPRAGTESGTDRWAVEQGWVSLTPLRLDLTDEDQLRAVRGRLPLDESLATAVSPAASTPQEARQVHDDEAEAGIAPALEMGEERRRRR